MEFLLPFLNEIISILEDNYKRILSIIEKEFGLVFFLGKRYIFILIRCFSC